MKTDRAGMHRRAQRAEGDLLITRQELDWCRKSLAYHWRAYAELRRQTPLKVDDLRGEFWVIRKPQWLR